MIFKMGEIFNGPGGLGYGAKTADVKGYQIDHVWANDYDESACATYRRNIFNGDPNAKVYHCPVQELNIDELEEIDAFAFGFPCNDYSIVGEQKGFSGDFGPLYTYGVKVINKFNPKFFVAENVGGLQSANDGSAFVNILADLATAGKYGYRLVPHLYKFEEYGVPQSRHRIIIVGIREDLNLDYKIPSPFTKDNPKTSKQAIEVPPIPVDAENHELTRHTAKVVEMLKHIPPGENAWYEGIPEHLRLKVKGARLSQIYRRLHPDKPSYTVTGSGGGGTHVYHWEEPRALTNRERARLQTFPDHFIFEGQKEKVRQQVGMAVPPAGAKIIFEAILKTFAEEPYESLEESQWWKGLKIDLKELKNDKQLQLTL
ncbi:DNA (cytosine-5-)-methyltransferase [Tumebacillus algifaecis]|uniref:Cytosine-specific methyltransferase n=1 Tax=Tumebacillus algifaecis TaxID=1214604 RepID=A0A223CZU5_9BACL|nr:DNA (cytosine-5-)-methyltransferase [Tumebacillus algifaecis]ASS74795.1 DNA (cytosine-5-)-methyltransferase [Tumebacillus algifaecis]